MLIWNEYIAIVKKLLENEGINIHKQDNFGRAPLFIACEKGHIDIVKELLENEGININKKDNLGKTPLDIVYERMRGQIYFSDWRSYSDIWDLLIEKGGEFVKYKEEETDTNPAKPRHSPRI